LAKYRFMLSKTAPYFEWQIELDYAFRADLVFLQYMPGDFFIVR